MQYIKNLAFAFSFASLITTPAISMEDPNSDNKYLHIFSQTLKEINNIGRQKQGLNGTLPQLPFKNMTPTSSPSINVPKPRLDDSSSEGSPSSDSSSDNSSANDCSPKNTPSNPQNLLPKPSLQKKKKADKRTLPTLQEDIFTLELSDKD